MIPARPIVRARRGRAFVAPRFSPYVFRFARRVAGLYLRFAMGIDRVEMHEARHLFGAIEKFQSGDHRLLIVFRHVATWDGPLVVWAVATGLRRWCRRNGLRLRSPPHTHFLYGKDVLNWAGTLARWAFPRLGGIPVVNGRIDRTSLSTIRRLAVSGWFPLALAPEAQVTYHAYHVADLAAGASSVAAWTHEALRASGQRVTLLPVAIGYDYGRDESRTLVRVTRRITRTVAEHVRAGRYAADHSPADRRDAGGHDQSGHNQADHGGTGVAAASHEPRVMLLTLTATVLGLLEREYLTQAQAPDPPAVEPREQTDPVDLRRRIDRLCRAILSRGESVFAYASDESTLQRVFRLRYRIMESLYREDVDPERLSPVSRALADHRAELAAGAQRHEQIVDLLEYLQPGYIPSGCSTKRLTEYALNLLDLTNRIRGGNIDTRYAPSGKRAHLLFGEPIDASGCLDAAASARDSTGSLTGRTQAAFEALAHDLEMRQSSDRERRTRGRPARQADIDQPDPLT